MCTYVYIHVYIYILLISVYICIYIYAYAYVYGGVSAAPCMIHQGFRNMGHSYDGNIEGTHACIYIYIYTHYISYVKYVYI